MHMNIIERTMPNGFQVFPEEMGRRTHAGLAGLEPPLNKDYELNPQSAECFLFLAAVMVLLRRIP